MKKYFPFLGAVLLVLCATFTTNIPQTHAIIAYTGPQPGTLIKGSGSAVYYQAMNEKRMVFPNEKTFKTWYADFSNVVTLSDTQLASIPLGGNVTYRPGVKLVKITTDPKVYAVSAHGILRWVTSEAIAQTLYGNDWNTKVDDVADAYFVNYTIGAPIQNASEYSPSQELGAANGINTDKFPPTPPLPPYSATPTSTSPTSTTPTSPAPTPSSTGVIFIASKTIVQAGDTITLQVYASDTLAVTGIELWFDGMLTKSCNSTACSTDVQIPLAGTKSSYTVEGRIFTLSQTTITKTENLTFSQTISPLAKIVVTQTVIRPGQAAAVIVAAHPSIASNRIDIYVDGNNIESCAGGAPACAWSDIVAGSIGSIHPIYGVITDTLGRTYTSPTLSITLSTNDAPGVTVAPAKPTIYPGEMVDITVTATDNDGVASIDVLKDGNVLKHCESGAPCTATTGPWNTLGSVTFTGRATDASGTVGYGDAQTVSVITQP